MQREILEKTEGGGGINLKNRRKSCKSKMVGKSIRNWKPEKEAKEIRFGIERILYCSFG